MSTEFTSPIYSLNVFKTKNFVIKTLSDTVNNLENCIIITSIKNFVDIVLHDKTITIKLNHIFLY